MTQFLDYNMTQVIMECILRFGIYYNEKLSRRFVASSNDMAHNTNMTLVQIM
jgi:hypothetical protein